MNTQTDIIHLVHSGNEIGEAPIWVPSESRIYWVDTEAACAFSYRPDDGETKRFALSLPVTAMLRRRGGGWVIVTKKGLAFWDQISGTCHFIANPVADNPDLCFNDGAVDRAGNIVAGTMNFREHKKPDGAIYSLAPNLRLKTLDTGLCVANGIGFSPDGGTMYVSEQFAGRILAYDYDQVTMSISGKRVFALVDAGKGLPDGITVDAEGFVWNGRWGGSTIARYAPDGTLDREIPLPVAVGTCIGFGGKEVNELYITTAWYGMDAKARAEKPYSGDLFMMKPGVRGIPEPAFAG
jgi:sugar lactone lactonase YvrE